MSYILLTPQLFTPPAKLIITEVSESFEWFGAGVIPPSTGLIDGQETLDFASGIDQDLVWSLMPIQSAEDASMIVDFRYRMSVAHPGTVKLRITPIVDGVTLPFIDSIFNPVNTTWKTQSIIALNFASYNQDSGIRFNVQRRGSEDTHVGIFHLQQTRARY